MSNFHAYIDPGYYLGDPTGAADYAFYYVLPPVSTATYDTWVKWWHEAHVSVQFICSELKTQTVPVQSIQGVVPFDNWKNYTKLSPAEVQKVKLAMCKPKNVYWSQVAAAWRSQKPRSGVACLEIAGEVIAETFLRL